MKITGLVLKNNRVQVFVDEEYAFSCTETFVVKNTLFRDLELTEEELANLRKGAQYSVIEFKLFEYAYRGRYSKVELKRKVSNYCLKKFDFKPEDEFLNKAIEKAMKIRLYSEEDAARNLVKLYTSRKKGSNYIYAKIISKGFAKDLIQEAIKNISPETTESNLEQILQKKLESLRSAGKIENKFDLKRKLIEFGVRKGYSFKEVNGVISNLSI